MIQNRIAFICFALFLLLIPCLAQAQDYAGKFGGWYLDADLLFGMGPAGDSSSEPGYYLDSYEGYHSDQSLQKYMWDDTNTFSFAAQVHAGYLFGSRVFVGPELSVAAGIAGLNFTATVDARARLVVPIQGGHAMNLAAGLGWVGGKYGNLLADPTDRLDDKLTAVEQLFIPIQAGYDYTFDNGFILGLSFQMNIMFADEKQYHVTERIDNPSTPEDMEKVNKWGKRWTGHWEDLDSTMAYFTWGVGIRLGYRFGK